MERRAVDHRVMRRDREPDDVSELVLEGAAQVRVDGGERQGERLVRRRALAARTGRGGRSLGGLDPVDRGGGPDGRRDRNRGQVERLQDEGRKSADPDAAVVDRVGQDQLVAGAGHRHVEQPPLLAQLNVLVRRVDLVAEGRGQRERVTPIRDREPTRDEAGQIHDRELQALCLVNREDGDRIRVGIEIRRRRIVAGLDQRLEMGSHERRPVIGEQR